MQSVNNDNCEVPRGDIAMPHNSERICPVVDDSTGDICGEKTGLEILNEFRQLYEQRIENIDPNSHDGVQEKMNILMEWIRDLDAQNTMLVSTVEELEKAACCRVKMLEEKLKNTSSALTVGISQYAKPTETILDNLYERIDKLEMNESQLQIRIKNLQSDIRGLLELIRRIARENSWSLHGIKFFETNLCEIAFPDESIYGQAMGDNKNIDILTQQLQLLNENEKKSIECQHELQQRVGYLSEELQDREEKLQILKSKFEDLKDSFKKRTGANADFENDNIIEETSQIIRLLDMEESDFITIENSDEDIQEESIRLDNVNVRRLQNELEEKTREIARLTQQFNELEKESLESREALAQEVAEKHDTALKFKQKVDELEEYGRRLTIQLKYKEDLIEQKRKELKLLKMKMGSMPSPTKVPIGASPALQRVTWGENIPGDGSEHIKAPSGSLLSTYPGLKTILMNENRVLKETIQDLHDVWYHTTLMEKQTHDQYLAAGQSRLDDIIAMLEEYRKRVNESSDQELTASGEFHCTDKLMRVLHALSDLCMDKSRLIIELESASQNVGEKNDDICDSSETENVARQNSNVGPQQFGAMREFRMCTVEAQAAVEDLRDEIETVMSNLNCRHQLFVDLCQSIETMQDVIARTKQHISTVLNSVKAHVEEKIMGNDTVVASQERLKEMKNEINEARTKFSASSNHGENEFDIYSGSYDRIVDEVESIMCNLKEFIVKDKRGLILLEALLNNVNDVEESLDKMQTEADHVLQENKIAQKVVDDKATRLDKLEQELDYAHTKMQDTLETIVIISQQNESSNGHSSSDDTLTKSDENSPQTVDEIDKLKISLSSKDKLLEHKDEIIRIQKDSMEMTQEEYKDLRQRLQSKIDAQVAVINQYLEEKMQLLEQNRLQNQTIKHLQDAVVEAKKNLNRQLPQKSAMHLGGGDGWSPITPPVFNNGNVHDEFIIAYERDFDHQMEHILRENNELKSQLMAYRQDFYTLMETEKRRNQMKGHRNCKIYPCPQTINELKFRLHENEKLLRESSEKLHITKMLLKEKSDELARLKADYLMINNECSIVKKENKSYEMSGEDNSPALQHKIEELQNDLCIVGDNYQRVCMDYEKSQKQLLEATIREVELQRSLNEALDNTTKDKTINDFSDLRNMLNLELEDTRAELNRKECALVHAQDVCKSSLEQIKFFTRQIKLLEERNIKLCEMNEYLMHQVQVAQTKIQYMKKNFGNVALKMKSKKSPIQKKIHGDGSWCRVWRKTISRCTKHAHRSARPYSSDITLSTCCSIRTITTRTRASMGDNSL